MNPLPGSPMTGPSHLGASMLQPQQDRYQNVSWVRKEHRSSTGFSLSAVHVDLAASKAGSLAAVRHGRQWTGSTRLQANIPRLSHFLAISRFVPGPAMVPALELRKAGAIWRKLHVSKQRKLQGFPAPCGPLPGPLQTEIIRKMTLNQT